MSLSHSLTTVEAIAPVVPSVPRRERALPLRHHPSYAPAPPNPAAGDGQVILTFDVEEHYRIEAAAGLVFDSGLEAHYHRRLDVSTRWLLDQLARWNVQATFFVVGKIAEHNPALIRAIHNEGHEVASHSWDHQRVHNLTPAAFREDVRRSKDALEQITQEPVIGYRAPTFSIVRETSWAIEVLAELGMQYDSSIFPVLHDRYGIPGAPRVPFVVCKNGQRLLEFPPATLRLLGTNLAVGGGGYFRLLPLFLLNCALWQLRGCNPPVAALYFHPWEFDPDQTRLPLRGLNRFRTYAGLHSSQKKLGRLLAQRRFTTARDVARRLMQEPGQLLHWHIPNGAKP